MAQATEDNTEKRHPIDDFDELNQHLVDAMGIVAPAHGASLANIFDERNLQSAMDVAYRALESAKSVVDRMSMPKCEVQGGV